MPDHFKVALRNAIKQVRSTLSIQNRSSSSNQICTRIRALEEYRKAKTIALYFAVNGEVDLTSIWNSAPLQGKFCYFPALNKDQTLSFLPATPKTPFINNKYGIPEPDVSREQAIPIEDINLIIMPLVAFDTRCTRLGMGAGYYDRTLEQQKKGTFIGAAYQFQHVDYLEPQAWDVPLDAVVTQKTTYWRHPKS
ncbi:5-formyltetrahydrofolate cyclo-ligase [uncultured Legionella sp.]|uniref:5-formyltetrahydrofolate cyclo-ligase n=1 Tax=uncultured Legionella sp. TaxID=210934 RepID=UPI00345CCB2E